MLKTESLDAFIPLTLTSGNRYILVSTENIAALETVETELKAFKREYRIIYGSSFPRDQAFSQVHYCKHIYMIFNLELIVNIVYNHNCYHNLQICTDINKIKVSMEIGETVILLNLEMLYDSLYDVLNQVI